MKKKYLTALTIVILIVGLYFLGNYLLTPKYDNIVKNPYDLNLDSIGSIDKQNYCKYISSAIHLNLDASKAIAVNNLNKIFVSGNDKIQILDLKGKLLNEIITDKTATALICSENQLIAALENHLEIFDLNGKKIMSWPPVSKNAYITSVVKIDNKIYAADAETEFVYEFNNNGEITDIYGDSVPPNSNLRFVLPSPYFDVAKDPEGFLWISNTGKHKLVNMNKTGELRSYWGISSSELEGFCGCCNPTHFAITDDGSFITSEKGIVRIKKYDAAGQFVCAIAGPDFFKKGSVGLDIALDNDQNVYVLEPDAKLIHIFKEK